MAGYIFSIFSKEGLEGVKKCIYEGHYASIAPNKKEIETATENAEEEIILEDSSGKNEKEKASKWKQIVSAVLADYCSMKAGDNVYFLSERKIYGVGKLINIGSDCKYKNYLSAHEFQYKKTLGSNDRPLKDLPPEYRWICFFEPEQQFFENGVDMDELLLYKPSAFKMLRAFQDVTFIKIDDEENRALKECLYLKNRQSQGYFEFSPNEHNRISKYNLDEYLIDMEEVLKLEYNSEKQEINLEMLLEAWIVDKIVKEGWDGASYDYVTHQVIASPFKPLAYIDKMDVFAYKFLENYPDAEKPIEQYLVIELKKDKANKEMPLQLMRYVDWISKEYASGDYSLIKAVGIANGYTKGIQKVVDSECVRSYLSDIHPNKSSVWKRLKLYEYYLDASGHFRIRESETFDKKTEIKDYLEKLGLETKTSMITVAKKQYKPSFKVQKKKWAFFDVINDQEKSILESAGWEVILFNHVTNKEQIRNLIASIF